jgi:predicted acyl esterase
VSSTAPDTDLWIEIADVGPDGATMPLQRGLLRASHRALDALRSDRTADGDIYRPYHPHTNPQPITPGQIYEYVIEIFPFGHIFRPGHSLQISVRTPPLFDNLNAYTPVRAAGINTIYHDPDERASSILLPFVPMPEELGPELACGQQAGIQCIPPQ